MHAAPREEKNTPTAECRIPTRGDIDITGAGAIDFARVDNMDLLPCVDAINPVTVVANVGIVVAILGGASWLLW